jgi:hypothetical protein
LQHHFAEPGKLRLAASKKTCSRRKVDFRNKQSSMP